MPAPHTALAAALALIPPVATPPAGPPLHQRIDRIIATGHPDYAKQAAPLSSDAEFLRRVSLDLSGTVPSADEVRAFLADRSPGKRDRVIDQLLAGPGYARRMAQAFDALLMERRPDEKVTRADWESYLRESFAAGKPYDLLVRELLAADGADPKARGPAKFLLDRKLQPEIVVRDISRLFLGRNLQCAQCHDHPLVEDYKQADYHGLLAFLNRSYLHPNDRAANAVIAEKADGEVTFTSVFDPGKKTHATGPRMPGGKPLAEPAVEKGKEYKTPPTKTAPGVPAYSRRARLAAAVAGPDNPAFARTAANRVWGLLLGRGLVHPYDLDHPGNPPSHPELLDLLAAEFAGHGYDVKHLVREIARSRTYQLSSEVPSGLSDVPADRFLVAALKPLSPEQFAHAALQATGRTDAERKALGAKATDAALDARLASHLGAFRGALAGPPGEPDDDFSPTLGQSLFVKHAAAVRQLIDGRAGTLVDRLAAMKDADAAADELFLSVLSRPPSDEERRDVAAALAAGGVDRKAAAAEVVWALLASAEFRFNH